MARTGESKLQADLPGAEFECNSEIKSGDKEVLNY